MTRILIKNGRLVDKQNNLFGKKADILIEDGMIKRIATSIFTNNAQVIDAKGTLVTAGLIDIHTHVFENVTDLGLNADLIGHYNGVSTVIDAGSAGVNNIDILKQSVAPLKTNVFALLNVASDGLVNKHELADAANIDEARIKEVFSDDFIVGLKARASHSVVKDLGIDPIVTAQSLANELKTSLTIHIGNNPPTIEEVLLTADDNTIITHAFNGKDNNILKSSSCIELLNQRISKGMKLDIGHGQDSFNYNIFKKAKDYNISYDFISTDLHKYNYEYPVGSQHTVITKLLHLGENFVDVIDKATYQPAQYFNLIGFGELAVGQYANISISSFKESDKILIDSDANRIQATYEYYPIYTITSKNKETEVYKHE